MCRLHHGIRLWVRPSLPQCAQAKAYMPRRLLLGIRHEGLCLPHHLWLPQGSDICKPLVSFLCAVAKDTTSLLVAQLSSHVALGSFTASLCRSSPFSVTVFSIGRYFLGTVGVDKIIGVQQFAYT